MLHASARICLYLSATALASRDLPILRCDVLSGHFFLKIVEMSFASLNLIPELLRAVEEQGYTEPTPIQAQAIPAILMRRDIMGCAQTGTGKTAGFTLPLLQLLSRHASTSTSPVLHPVRALVLVPTRELAAQVDESVRTYGKYVPLRATVLYGGIDIKPQKLALQRGIEIVVATPGRLLDHLEGKSINLARVEILVLDEADRMLDMGFMPAIKRILAALPPVRQNLLFSATFSEEIKRLANEFMRNPTMIEAERRNSPAELVTHQAYEVATERKHALLTHLIKTRDIQQALIFMRMKRDADRLARLLQRDGLLATAIHGDRSQLERTQALDEFKSGKMKILVATDVAARGIDIDQLPFVINYEIPNTPEDYVHRIGRTGRAGSPGEAISLVSPDEMEYLAAIEKLLKRPIPRVATPELEGERGRGRTGGNTGSTGSSAERSRERSGERSVAQSAEGGSARRASPRDERDSGRPRRDYTSAAPLPALAANGSSFDFSKPYEPTLKSGDGVDSAQPATTMANQRQMPRSIGALLGRRNEPKVEES